MPNIIFTIELKSGSRRYHMGVERTWVGDTKEEYTVSPIHNPRKSVKLENNRPLLRNKLKLKDKRIQWKVVEGQINNVYALEEVCRLIEQYVDAIPQLPPRR